MKKAMFISTSLTLRGSVLLLEYKLYYIPMVYYRAFQEIHQECRYICITFIRKVMQGENVFLM